MLDARARGQQQHVFRDKRNLYGAPPTCTRLPYQRHAYSNLVHHRRACNKLPQIVIDALVEEFDVYRCAPLHAITIRRYN